MPDTASSVTARATRREGVLPLGGDPAGRPAARPRGVALPRELADEIVRRLDRDSVANLCAAGGPLAPAAARGVAIWRLIDRIGEAVDAGDAARLRSTLDELRPSDLGTARRVFATRRDGHGRTLTAQLAAEGAVRLVEPLAAAGLGLHERDALGGNAANAAHLNGHAAAEGVLARAGAPRLLLDESPLVTMVRHRLWPLLATYGRRPDLLDELGGRHGSFFLAGPSLPCTHRLGPAPGAGGKRLPLTLAAQFGHRPPPYVEHLFGGGATASEMIDDAISIVGLLCAQPRVDVSLWLDAFLTPHPLFAWFPGPLGYAPLHLAAGLSAQPARTVAILLAAGADADVALPDRLGATPLTLAAKFARAPKELVALLLRHGARARSQDLRETMRRPRAGGCVWNPRRYAAAAPGEQDAGAAASLRAFGDLWPQHTTPTWRPTATLLCAHGAPCRMESAREAIHSRHQVQAKLRFLFRHGADLREIDGHGATWLNMLLGMGDRVGLDVVADAILAGADVNQPGDWFGPRMTVLNPGVPPLRDLATVAVHEQALRRAQMHPATQDTRRGIRPVHVAALSHPDPCAALTLLARHGADLWARTDDAGLTPDDLLARRGGHDGVRAWLAARPARNERPRRLTRPPRT